MTSVCCTPKVSGEARVCEVPPPPSPPSAATSPPSAATSSGLTASLPLRSFRERECGCRSAAASVSATEIELDAVARRAQEVLQARPVVPVLVHHLQGSIEIGVGLRLRRTFSLRCQVHLYRRIRAGEYHRRDDDGCETKPHITRVDSAPREGRRRRRRAARIRRVAGRREAPPHADDDTRDRDQNRHGHQHPGLGRELQAVLSRG